MHTRQPCDDAVVRAGTEVEDCKRSIGRWVLAAAILGSGITFIDGTVINVALPVLQVELGTSVSAAQWIVEAYALMLASLILVGGSLGDRLGRRRIFMIGVALFGAASVWCGLAFGIKDLIAARTVQGLGAALLVPGSLALTSANFPKRNRGRAIGTWSGFTSIAAGLGPVLGGWLVANVSWRWVFLINIPLVTAVLVICWFRVPESRDEETKGRIDWVGALFVTAGLGGIVFGLIESNSAGFGSSRVLLSLALGVVALVAFVYVEWKKHDPMMPLSLFSSTTFSGANLLTLFLYAALGGIMFFLPFNLIQVQGYSPTYAGAALLPFVFTMFILSRWAGGLVDRYGSKMPLIVGPIITAAGFALFALPGAQSRSFWMDFFPAIMFMSIGMSIAVAPLTTTVMGAVKESHAGVASGINNAVSRAASLIAVAAFGAIMFAAFSATLSNSLSNESLPESSRASILAQRGDLINIRIPSDLTSEQMTAVSGAIRMSFVTGFRYLAFTAAGLAVLSAIASGLLIEGKHES